MSEQALSIVGSSRRNGERDLFDFYPTPPDVTRALLMKEQFHGSILEPACGDGLISKVLIENGKNVTSSDLVDRGYGSVGKDFLKTDVGFDNIITNPPFNLALDFVLHSKIIARKKIAMFLKTTFLESSKRYGMFKDEEFPLKCMYQFSKRVRLVKNGVPMVGKSGMIAFAWFVWDREYVGKPYIDWII